MTPQLIFEWVSVAALLGALFFFVAAVRSMFAPKDRESKVGSNVVVFKKRTLASKVTSKEKLDAWKNFKDNNSGNPPIKPDGDGTK